MWSNRALDDDIDRHASVAGPRALCAFRRIAQ
jgi:hypothetical protein